MNEIIEQFAWWSALDITLIAIGTYYILLLIKGTRAAQMLTGLLIIAAVFLVSSWLPLTTVSWVLNKFYSSIILILIIIFQDDVRHALRKIGRKSFFQGQDNLSSQHILDEISRAAAHLSKRRIGALLVIERSIILSRYIDIGTLIDGRISKELILAVFHPASPIHDGAVIIQRGRLAAAGCFLPLTRQENLLKNWGTRHRAAMGISQETDAVVLIVSEESGKISLVEDGVFMPVPRIESLSNILSRLLISEDLSLKLAGRLKRTSLLEKIKALYVGKVG
jgi:diadenylate cyclase